VVARRRDRGARHLRLRLFRQVFINVRISDREIGCPFERTDNLWILSGFNAGVVLEGQKPCGSLDVSREASKVLLLQSLEVRFLDWTESACRFGVIQGQSREG
jgi:hypothetical protein